MKLLQSLFVFSSFAMAQNGNVSTFNFCSTCAIRQFIPGSTQIPPQVEVFIYDPPSGNAAYLVTLVYQGQDGNQHAATQLVIGSGQQNTVWLAMVDAASIASVLVQPMAYTGSQIKTP